LGPVPGWVPSASPFTRLGQAPKHHPVDPALAAKLLAATPTSLLTTGGAPGDMARAPRDGPLLGALFESLVTLSVRVYAQAAQAAVYHLRTRNGDHEIDLIVEGPDRRVVAIEVKLAPTVDDSDTTHMHWLRAEIGSRLANAVVVTTGPSAYRRPDGIAVVPAALLGP
jgi:predicted AAA+ superfamily ATPase